MQSVTQRVRAAFAACLVISSAVIASDARAVDVLINTHTNNNQWHPAAARVGGGFVVTWQSDFQDGTFSGIYAAMFGDDGLGEKLIGEFRVNGLAHSGELPAITGLNQPAIDQNPLFVIIWQAFGRGGSTYDIYGQLYNRLGHKLGGEFRVNGSRAGEQTDAAVAGLADGGFIVVWTSTTDGFDTDIHAQRFTATGAKAGKTFRVNKTKEGAQAHPAVTALNAADGGGFVVVWDSDGQDGSFLGVYGQRFAADGTKVGKEFRINKITESGQQNPKIATMNNGRFIVVWSHYDLTHEFQIIGQIYEADGTKVGGQFKVNKHNPNYQIFPDIAAYQFTPFHLEGFMVTWQSLLQDGSGYGIYAQEYNMSGQKVGTEFKVNTVTADEQNVPVVAWGFKRPMILWESFGQDGSLAGVYGADVP